MRTNVQKHKFGVAELGVICCFLCRPAPVVATSSAPTSRFRAISPLYRRRDITNWHIYMCILSHTQERAVVLSLSLSLSLSIYLSTLSLSLSVYLILSFALNLGSTYLLYFLAHC